MKARFQEIVKELVDVDEPNLWNTFKNCTSQACAEVCGKKKGRRNHGDSWWWNKEMKEAIRQKKKGYKKMCKNRSEENKTSFKNIKNQTKKVIANSMKKEAKKESKKLNEKPNNIFALVKFMKKDGKDIEAGRCVIGKDARFQRKRQEKNMEKSHGDHE